MVSELVAAITADSALVGGFQRVRADRALAELFAQSAIGARVRREGRERLVTSGDLVPGDVISLRPEDVVPADCRLLEAEGLEDDESSLTGESLAASKDPAPVVAPGITGRRSMLYEGTTVSSGRAVAAVVATGSATEAGRSLATARQATPETGVEARGIRHRLARNGIESSQRLGRHRWVVRRTMSWLSGCRRLHRRYEHKPEHFLAFTAIAVTLICHRRLAK